MERNLLADRSVRIVAVTAVALVVLDVSAGLPAWTWAVWSALAVVQLTLAARAAHLR